MEKKLRVAQITPFYYPSIGGVQGVVKYISEELVKRNHYVDIITAYRDHGGRPTFNIPKVEFHNGVKIFRYKSILDIGHMSLMPSLVRHLIKYKYDILHYHVHRHPHCNIAAFFGKMKSSVNILHGHGPFFEKGEVPKFKQFLYDFYDKIASVTTLKWTDKIFAFNKYEIDNFIRLTNNPDKVCLILNAANSDSFLEYDTSDFLKKYQLQGKKLIVCVGILNEAKRQDLLIEALPLIVKEIPTAFLLLVGPDGGYLKRVKALAEKLNVTKFYKYLGTVSDEEKNQALEAALVFTLVSDKDAYPLAIAEAMAHHTPVVATDARGPVSMVHDGLDGLIVKKRDVSGIAMAVVKLLKNDDLREEMSKKSRSNADKNYKATGIVDQVEKIYYDVMLEKKKNIG
jgi:glycosyltransferase involved in cell wall biosynthesis